MTSKILRIAFASLALNLSFPAAAQATRPEAPAGAEAPRAGHPRRRGELSRFLKTLRASKEQRALVLEEARAAAPIASAARLETAKIRAEARRQHEGDPAAAKAQMRKGLKALRERTLEKLQPLSQRVLSTLTPEQRQRLEQAAKKHGRTLDEARLEKITSWLLTRPSTIARLERRADRTRDR